MKTAAQHQAPGGNSAIAEQIERVAELLEAQTANPNRVRADRRVAAAVGALTQPVHAIVAAEGGAGLRRRTTWARTLALVVGLLNLVNVPPGTLLGDYTLWVLTQPDVDRYVCTPRTTGSSSLGAGAGGAPDAPCTRVP